MWIILGLIGVLILALVWIAGKCLMYYGSTLGLLYYLGTKHDDLISADKCRELRDYALQRRIKEFASKNYPS